MFSLYNTLLGNYALLSALLLGLLPAAFYFLAGHDHRSPVRVRLVARRSRGKIRPQR